MLTDLSYQALEFIALNLRAADKEEIFAVLDHDSPLQFAWEAHQLMRNKGRCVIGWHQGRPAAWIGLVEMIPRVWQITMGGTDDLPRVALACMRWARESIPSLLEEPLNGYRLYCDARVGPLHHEQHKFLRALGALPEGPPRPIGKDEGIYQHYVWLKGKNGFVAKSGKAAGAI